jgi:hypothetical protein
MWPGSRMLKESYKLADIRTEIRVLRGLLNVTTRRTALSCPRLAQKNEGYETFPGSAKLIIHRNVFHACCLGVQLVVSGLQRVPGCYSMIWYGMIYIYTIYIFNRNLVDTWWQHIAHIYTQTIHRIQRMEHTQQSKNLTYTTIMLWTLSYFAYWL